MGCQEIAIAIGLFQASEHWSKDDYRRFNKAEEVAAKLSAVRNRLQELSQRFIVQDKKLARPDFIERMVDPEIDAWELFKRDQYELDTFIIELKLSIGEYHELQREILLKSKASLQEKKI